MPNWLSGIVCGVLLLAVFAGLPAPCAAEQPPPSPQGAASASQALLESLDPSEREWLRLHPVVRVGGPLAFQPFHFHGDDGSPQGMAFDFLRLVLRTIGLEMQTGPARPWPQVLDAARHGEIDLISCAARSADREAYLIFSDPVLSFPMVIVGRKDGPFISGLEDLRGLKVALVRGNVTADWLTRDEVEFVPREVSTPLDALRAVSLGTADAHIENLAAATFLIEKHGLANLKIAAPTPYGNYDLRFAVRKDWPELASIINKALRTLEPGQAAGIRQAWLAVRFEHGLRPLDVAKWFAVAGIPVFTVLVTLFVGYRRLRREVAGRAQTEDALRRERDRSLRYLDTVQTMIVALDTEGCITMINRAGRELLGYAEEELLGRNWFAFCLPQPEGMKTIFPRFHSIIEGHQEGTLLFENTVLRKDGTRRLIGWRNTYLRDEAGCIVGAISSGEDITERKQTEEALAANERRFKELIRNSSDSVTILAQDGTQLFVSQAAERMLGYTPEELTNIPVIDEMLHPDDRERVKESFAAIIREGYGGTQYRHRHKDGRWVHLEAWGTNQLDNPDIRGIVVNVRDITERKQAEERMQAAMESLSEAKAAAEAANVAKSEFLANMSHEIRTPVNGVMGMLQILQTTSLTPEQSGYASKAVQSCKRLANLLGDILDLSRIEAGKLVVSPAPMGIPDVFEQVHDLFRTVALERGVQLGFSTDPPVLPRILGDAARLQQILVNLVGNALKFTEAGEVSVSAQALSPLRPGHCRILFSVTDTGIGIPDEKLPLLFKPFSQAHGGYARAHQGAGLGLSICKRLVDLMGGTMTVASEQGRGTTVAFCLRFAEDASQTRPAQPRDARRTADLQGQRILLAEDDPVSALAGRMLLFRQGAEVTLVQDGKQALRALEQAPFDLVLMDVQMPFMDGIETTMAIRSGLAGDAARNIPIIAMTAYAMAGDREAFLNAGMTAYIAKPMALAELLDVIADSLRV